MNNFGYFTYNIYMNYFKLQHVLTSILEKIDKLLKIRDKEYIISKAHFIIK